MYGVDIDEWREGGKVGQGWDVKVQHVDPRQEDEGDSERSSDGGSEASAGEESEDDQAEGEDEGVKLSRGKRKAKTDGRPTKSTKKAKAGRTSASTPRKSTGKRLPHPKASSSRLPVAILSPAELPTDPYERALRLLHVGATPESLPCREEEFVDVLSRVEEGVEGGGGGCLCECLSALTILVHKLKADIAGVPGTGKTATVHAVVKELKRKAEDGVRALQSYGHGC